MKTGRNSLLIFLFLCQHYHALTADTIPFTHKGLQAHYGFIIPHSKAIEPVSHTNPFGFEFSISKLHTSYNSWKIFNAYWISGIRAGYFNFQNPEVLGSSLYITFFAEPLLSRGEKYFISLRGGAGLSYHNMYYDKFDNPSNQFFSTRFNFPLFADLRLKYRLSGRTYITFSGCYNHISNGGYKQPNKGMNFPTLAVGLEHFSSIVPSMDDNYISELKIPKPGLSLLIQTLSAFKILEENDEYPEEPAFVLGFHARISKQLRTFYALNSGAELIFDGYIRETIKREQTGIDYKRFAVTAGQEFMFGRVVFTQYLGFYIYSPYKARNPVYQKYELAYRFNSRILAGVYLKSHLHVAELMGLNLSFILFN